MVGQKSDEWQVYPLATESKNIEALQDYIINHGAPEAIRSDNAKRKTDCEWMNYCQKFCVEQQQTVPHSPWMNFAEQKIWQLNSMVKKCMTEFKIPLKHHDWVQ